MVDSSRMVFINTPNNLHQQLGVYQKKSILLWLSLKVDSVMIICRKRWWWTTIGTNKNMQKLILMKSDDFFSYHHIQFLGKSINQHLQIHPNPWYNLDAGPWAMIPKWSIWEQRLVHWFIVLDAIEIITGRPPTYKLVYNHLCNHICVYIYVHRFIHTPYFLVIIVTKPQTTTLVMAQNGQVFAVPILARALGNHLVSLNASIIQWFSDIVSHRYLY